jgi:hypothetical protein
VTDLQDRPRERVGSGASSKAVQGSAWVHRDDGGSGGGASAATKQPTADRRSMGPYAGVAGACSIADWSLAH